MSLISLVVVLIVVGLILYLLNTLPIDGTMKTIIHAVVIVFVVIWLLQSIGVIGSIGNIGIR